MKFTSKTKIVSSPNPSAFLNNFSDKENIGLNNGINCTHSDSKAQVKKTQASSYSISNSVPKEFWKKPELEDHSTATHSMTSGEYLKCVFHPNKRAKYRLDLKFLICSKCAVTEALRGKNVTELNFLLQNNSIEIQSSSRKKEIDCFMNNTQTTKTKLKNVFQLCEDKQSELKGYLDHQILTCELLFQHVIKIITENRDRNISKLSDIKSSIEDSYRNIFVSLNSSFLELDAIESDINTNQDNIMVMENEPYVMIMEKYSQRLSYFKNYSEEITTSKFEVFKLNFDEKLKREEFINQNIATPINEFFELVPTVSSVTKKRPEEKHSSIYFSFENKENLLRAINQDLNMNNKDRKIKTDISLERDQEKLLTSRDKNPEFQESPKKTNSKNSKEKSKSPIFFRESSKNDKSKWLFQSPIIDKSLKDLARGIFSSPHFKNRKNQK